MTYAKSLGNVQQLRELMQQHNLSNRQMAEITGFSIKAFESWLASRGSNSGRNFSSRNLVLINTLVEKHVNAKELAKTD